MKLCSIFVSLIGFAQLCLATEPDNIKSIIDDIIQEKEKKVLLEPTLHSFGKGFNTAVEYTVSKLFAKDQHVSDSQRTEFMEVLEKYIPQKITFYRVIKPSFDALSFIKISHQVGIDFHAPDKDDEFLLNTMAKNGDLEAIKYLVELGVDVNLVNYCQETALQVSIQNNHNEITEFLLENGANPFKVDTFGESALYDAIAYKYLTPRIIDLIHHVPKDSEHAQRLVAASILSRLDEKIIVVCLNNISSENLAEFLLIDMGLLELADNDSLNELLSIAFELNDVNNFERTIEMGASFHAIPTWALYQKYFKEDSKESKEMQIVACRHFKPNYEFMYNDQSYTICWERLVD